MLLYFISIILVVVVGLVDTVHKCTKHSFIKALFSQIYTFNLKKSLFYSHFLISITNLWSAVRPPSLFHCSSPVRARISEWLTSGLNASPKTNNRVTTKLYSVTQFHTLSHQPNRFCNTNSTPYSPSSAILL